MSRVYPDNPCSSPFGQRRRSALSLSAGGRKWRSTGGGDMFKINTASIGC